MGITTLLYPLHGKTRHLFELVQHADHSKPVTMRLSGVVLHNEDDPERMQGYVTTTYTTTATDRERRFLRVHPGQCSLRIGMRPFGLELGGTFSHVLHLINQDNHKLVAEGLTVIVHPQDIHFTPNGVDSRGLYSGQLEDLACTFFQESLYCSLVREPLHI